MGIIVVVVAIPASDALWRKWAGVWDLLPDTFIFGDGCGWCLVSMEMRETQE